MQRATQSSRSQLFPAVPNPERYAAVGSVEAARTRLLEVVRGAEGIGVLVGPTGTGKSLLCCLLAEALQDEFHVVLLADSQFNTGETLLKHILFHLHMPYRDLSEGELRLSLIDHLTQGMRGSTQSALALIIDEAQTLSPSLLEEVRMITNIVRDGQPRVRTVLAGGPELDDRLADPKLESLNQRIASRCYLHPLTVEETARYVHDAAMRSGLNPGALIDDNALHVIYQATGGVPRLINQLMRQTIATCPNDTIRADHVNRAWQSLQQLPSPLTNEDTNGFAASAGVSVLRETEAMKDANGFGSANAIANPESSIIEFGALSPETAEDDGADAPKSQEVAAEPVDPIAEADPAVAAELQRVTESLQRLAQADTEEACPDAADAAEWTVQWSEERTGQAAVFEETVVPAAHDDPAWYDSSLTVNLESEESWSPEEKRAPNLAESTLAEKPSAPVPPTVLPAEELFGADFEDEETIPAERNYGPSFEALYAIGPPSESLPELEEEIGSDRFGIIDAAMQDDGDSLIEVIDEEPVSYGANVQGDAAPQETNRRDDPQTVAFPRKPTSPSTAEAYGDIHLSDDSDLLVIEESVEVAPVRVQAPLFDDDPSDSRDYQMLLNRMRQG